MSFVLQYSSMNMYKYDIEGRKVIIERREEIKKLWKNKISKAIINIYSKSSFLNWPCEWRRYVVSERFYR